MTTMPTMPTMPIGPGHQDVLETASFEQQLAWIRQEADPNAALIADHGTSWSTIYSWLGQVRDGLQKTYDGLVLPHTLDNSEVPAPWPASEEGKSREVFLSKSRNAIDSLNRTLAKIKDNPKLLSDLVTDIGDAVKFFEQAIGDYAVDMLAAGVPDVVDTLGNQVAAAWTAVWSHDLHWVHPVTEQQDKVREAYRQSGLVRLRALNEHFDRVAAALAESVTETWQADRGNLRFRVPI